MVHGEKRQIILRQENEMDTASLFKKTARDSSFFITFAVIKNTFFKRDLGRLTKSPYLYPDRANEY